MSADQSGSVTPMFVKVAANLADHLTPAQREALAALEAKTHRPAFDEDRHG